MKLVIASLLLLTSIATADKTFNDGKGETVDCGKDPNVTINNSNAEFKLTGACKKVVVNGSTITFSVEEAEAITINGSTIKGTIGAVDKIQLNGSSNEITWKKGKTGAAPKVNSVGSNNTIGKAK